MALNVAIQLSSNSITPPQTVTANLLCYNPGAAATTVTNVQLQVTPLGSTSQATACPSMVAPIGPGANVSVPALGTLTVGPFTIAAPNLGAGGTFASLNNPPTNVQATQPLQQVFAVNALVYDSAAGNAAPNTASPAAFMVSYVPPPPTGTMGGVLQFNAPSNSLGMLGIGWP